MGVEYEQFLIPRRNAFRPTAEKVIELLHELAKGRWIRTPESPNFDQMEKNNMPPEALRTGAQYRHGNQRKARSLPWPIDVAWLEEQMSADLRLIWPVGSLERAGLRYPLSTVPDMPREELYYDVRLDVSTDYVYRISENINPFDSTVCSCGEDLSFSPKNEDIFFSSRIHVACPRCRREIDISRMSAVILDGWTGEERRVHGGATSRFAMVVDCGKAFPRVSDIEAEPELLRLLNDVFGCQFYQVGSVC